jgi:hypothetical protein
MDLYTTEIRHWWAGQGSDGSEVLVNQGEAAVRFSRPGRDASGTALPHDGPTWDEGHITAAVIDFDNDGRQDLYLGGTDYAGNRGRLYHNVTDGLDPQFAELTTDEFFEHNRSHGIGVADFDRDGDLDILVGHSRNRCDANAPHNCYETASVRYFENTWGQQNNWIQLDLEGAPGTNRGAVGAQVTVEAGGVSQVQEVGGGYGHYGAQQDRILHFGLNASCETIITVRWPNRDRTTQRVRLGSGYRYKLVQGELAVVQETD